MKNTFKILGIAAIVAVIGFSFASCLSLGNGGAGVAGAGFGRAGATTFTFEWPSQDVWERYGIAGGLQQPSGTNVAMVFTDSYGGLGSYLTVGLESANRATFDNLVSQIERKGGWTVYSRESNRNEEAIVFVRGGINSIAFVFDTRENGISIMATPDFQE